MATRKIAGVCGGLARYLEWDVTIVRVLFIVGLLLKGATFVAYLVLWVVMPRDDQPAVLQAEDHSPSQV